MVGLIDGGRFGEPDLVSKYNCWASCCNCVTAVGRTDDLMSITATSGVAGSRARPSDGNIFSRDIDPIGPGPRTSS